MSETSRTTAGAAGRALVPFERVAATEAGASPRAWHPRIWLAALVGVFGLGAAGTHAAQLAWSTFGHRSAVQASATEQTLRRLEEEVGRLKGSVDTLRAAAETGRQDEAMRTLRHTLEAVKADIQQARSADGVSLQQIAAKLDKPDHDPSPKLAEIVARLDRIEHDSAAKPPAEAAQAKLAEIATRLDRVEHQVAAPAAPVVAPQPARAAATPAVTTVSRTAPAVPPVKPDKTADGKPGVAHPATLAAWVVRDVYDGTALVEGRNGGLREVAPGQFLPGAGRIRSIERRGRAWVVLTSQGVIGTPTF